MTVTMTMEENLELKVKADINEIKVGDKVYEAVKNGLREYTVCKVGRKYFYLEEEYFKTPFGIESLEYVNKDYSQRNRKLWRTIEEYENFINQVTMLKELRETLYPDRTYRENPKIPLAVYLQICELLDIKSNFKADIFME